MYPTIITQDSVVLIKGGKFLTANKSHINYSEIINRIKKGLYEDIENLFNVAKAIENYMGVKVLGNEVFYNGNKVHGVLVNKILCFMKEGLPHLPLVKFLEKLMQNPSKRSVDFLYTYLEKYKLPICEDGDFIACKAIRNNWTDKHSGSVSNKIGDTPEMPRNSIDDNPDLGCSQGLHVGAMDYVSNYGSGNDRFIMVKINPRDVVSVPKDDSYRKIRVCRYEVIGEISKETLGFESDYAPKNANYQKVEKDSLGRVMPQRDDSGRFVKGIYDENAPYDDFN
ncbi:MAG: hypothetical protein AABY22_30200 [Nanoarchaeota archaeon]